MKTETVLFIVAETLKKRLNYNEVEGNDLVKIVTDAIINAELTEDRRQFEHRQASKANRMRHIVANSDDYSTEELIKSIKNGGLAQPIRVEDINLDPNHNVRYNKYRPLPED